MKKIDDTLDSLHTRGDFRQLTKSAQHSDAQRLNDRDRLWPLWNAMTEAYGRQFTSQFGAEPLPAWVAGLSQFTDDQIREGYTRALQDCREFVPNLSMMVSYIGGGNDWEHRRLSVPASQVLEQQQTRLPSPDDDEVARKYLADMKANLGLK